MPRNKFVEEARTTLVRATITRGDACVDDSRCAEWW
jgi:hypothetical protein